MAVLKPIYEDTIHVSDKVRDINSNYHHDKNSGRFSNPEYAIVFGKVYDSLMEYMNSNFKLLKPSSYEQSGVDSEEEDREYLQIINFITPEDILVQCKTNYRNEYMSNKHNPSNMTIEVSSYKTPVDKLKNNLETIIDDHLK